MEYMKRIVLSICVCLLALTSQSQVTVGAECTGQYMPLLEGLRVAVCGNQTSMVGGTHLVDTLLGSGVSVVKIFCPEHGFRGNAEAGAHIASSVDPQTGVQVVSLYGRNRKPTPEQMADVDVVLFDLQDVGCRFYTYISTLHYVMEAAAESECQVVVLDRPNPNGFYVDGPVLDPKFASFVGMHPVPVVYGMTIGEYARMINGEGWLKGGRKCALTVIELEGYTHATRYKLPVAPSPNLQTPEAVFLYPSLCLFEGTAVSVGRGTPTPFQLYGFPGFTGGNCTFTPVAIKGVSENPPHKERQCSGIDLTAYAQEHLHDAGCLRLEYLLTAYKRFGDKEKFFTNGAFFDKLAGTDLLRKQILQGWDEAEIRASWKEGLDQFKTVREHYLIYD